MTKISLIHPSRGRAKQASETLNKWLSKASGFNEIEHILSVDLDDSQLELYKALFKEGSTICASANDSVVQATNVAAKVSRGDILIYLSDDFDCPIGWDQLIIDSVAVLNNPELWLLKVDDCLQRFKVDVLTIPIMSKALHKRLGYFWNPLYLSMFVDQDLYHVCDKNQWLIFAEPLKFPHLHYTNPDPNLKSQIDETYQNSSNNWAQGKAVYHKRRAEGFPV